jgi:hemolysin III
MDQNATAARRAKGYLTFPDYSLAERIADAVIHLIGVPLGITAGFLLFSRAAAHGGFVLIATTFIYVFGLIGMLASSAAYQLSRPGLAKERLRRLDRAMIFVMIAGTYTPISANVLYGSGGIGLCEVLWGLAGLGIFASLRFPRRFERPLLGLYLAMGWMLVILIRDCFSALSLTVLSLILAGGLAYTIGAIIQAQGRLKFHNPIWHGLILIAASLQYAAISLQLFGRV